jgi:predicted nucleic acid-binding protein
MPPGPGRGKLGAGAGFVTVYLDANIVIYLVEHHPIWGTKAQARISQLRASGDQIAVSDAHRLECLVGPLILNDQKTLADYAAFFNDASVTMISLAQLVWERAARIRAAHSFKPLDSLHLATTVENGCGLFVTKDVQLRSFPDILVEVLT